MTIRERTARLRDWLRRPQLDAELEEELRFHHASLERDGMTPREARRQLGNLTRLREEARSSWAIPWIDNLHQDVRYALRGLNQSRGFTLTVMLTLGLGIGVNAAIFGVVDRLMFAPFPYLRDPSSINRVYLETTVSGKTNVYWDGPYTRYVDFQHLTSSFQDFAGVSQWTLAIGSGLDAREHEVAGVSASFFGLFSATPVIGRYFGPSEDSVPRGADVAVLSYAFWRSEFGGRHVIGTQLRVGPLLTTIIGVAPEGFVGVTIGEPPAVFLPITALAYGVNQGDAQSFAAKYGWTWMSVIVRRKAGVSEETASADLTRALIVSRSLQRAINPRTLPDSIAHPRAIAGALKTAAGPAADLEAKTLRWVSGVALIVFVIACVNVANLLFARMLKRRREIAVRLALGAGRRRLIAQFLTESLILSGLGCATGIVIAQWASAALGRMLIRGGGAATVTNDTRMLLLAGGCALTAGIVTGVGPAVLALRGDLSVVLRADARSGTYTRSRLRSSLLVLQAALSVVLLVGAGLFVRSLINVRDLPLGWDPAPVLVVTPNYRGVKFDSLAFDAFRRRLLAAAQGIPGVTAAARVNSMPFATNSWSLHIDGIDSVEKLGRFNYQATSADILRTLGIPVVRGRGLTDDDRGRSAPVVLVSQSMARVLWPGQNALDKCVRLGSDTSPCRSVVGIVGDVVQQTISDRERFMFYVSDEQPPFHPTNRIFLRMSGRHAAARINDVRETLQRIMPGEAYVNVSLLVTVVETQRRSWTLGATMFIAFGLLALIVAAVGLYGVIGYTVAQRMHELGVRLALGAQARDIATIVVAHGMSFAASGIALGLALALLLTHWVEPLLFNESARDPVVYAGVMLVMGAAGMIASAIPALRAVHADPTTVLRSD